MNACRTDAGEIDIFGEIHYYHYPPGPVKVTTTIEKGG